MKNHEKLQFIINKYRENKNSHVYLVETNSIENAVEDIKNLIKEINCLDNISKLIDSNNLPTLSIVWPENQEIKKEMIEELLVKVQKIPVITKENYFIICDAEKLNQKSGNIMLKMIEDPPTDIIGFFVCNNSNNVLKTIQSRSQFLSLSYSITEKFDEEMINIATDYVDSFHREIDLTQNKIISDTYKDINSICNFLECVVHIEKKIISDNKNFDIIKKEGRILELIYDTESNIRKNCNITLMLDRFLIEVGRIV